ncbi:MAG: hypothetical protein LBT14_07985 [Treponema sp.]|jgi:predicted nucleic acid-binding Zn ribbon protein|nr:hypothetical protein [Treponema sp.]
MLLLYFGYTLVFKWKNKNRLFEEARPDEPRKPVHERVQTGRAPQTCPVCSTALEPGRRVKTAAFPAVKGERLMHIRGCPSCLVGKQPRICPVCGAMLTLDEILIAKMVERPDHTHVHILGCTRCCGAFNKYWQ